VEGDVTDRASLRAFVAGAEGATLFHCAGVIHPARVSEFDAVNAGGSMEALVESTVARFLTPETVKTRPEVADAVRTMVRNTPIAGYIACCQAIAKLNLTDRLRDISIPTMVVVGADDPATTVEMARTIHQRIAGSELVILKNAAHLSNLEQTDAFNEAVLGFLGRH
jgi:3-oxoadipate enol-lactonase